METNKLIYTTPCNVTFALEAQTVSLKASGFTLIYDNDRNILNAIIESSDTTIWVLNQIDGILGASVNHATGKSHIVTLRGNIELIGIENC
jgi:hypothetical protein